MEHEECDCKECEGKHEQPRPRPCAACGGMGTCPNCGGTGCMSCDYSGKCQSCRGTGDAR